MGIEAVVDIGGELVVGSFTALETVIAAVVDTVDIVGVVDSKSVAAATLMASARVVTITRSFFP